ncbi:sigma-70 family RNA polymerase sigma factor [Yinghuangia seranimata]|uniref:sigma-70 family RNA polymerase sigma factor n=1 Tax=Yinghuangia seranimata TaxID=408067 RepID=UPI00248BD9FA|nr:sigma-70 family RNA polymerase sigma factor [Yinghuangia seranimata]MDI2128870.1 sigma-70 family RNA polymerase sigma factor [Yinghuangia seranimata]
MASCPAMDGDTGRTTADEPRGIDFDTAFVSEFDSASDPELTERVRAGGPDAEAAFAALHQRHHAAALRHARRVESDADAAEDLVSDAFVEVLAQLRRGGGPRESFRAYLCTTIRNGHADRAKARSGVVLTGDAADLDKAGGPAQDSPADALPDLMLVQQAFGSLPDRWQAVLWHTEVEGEKPRHIARLLGITPNAVSQLAVRAREGLSEAFLRAHVGRLPEHCRDYGDRLGGYVRGTLRIRDRRAVDNHLADCGGCTRVYAELTATNAHLRVLLLPAVLGASAAAVPLLELVAGTATAAGAGAAGTGTVGTGTAAGTAAGSGGSGTGTAAASGSGTASATPAPVSGAARVAGKTGSTTARNAFVGGGIASAVAAGIALALVMTGGTPTTTTPLAQDRADLVAEPAPSRIPEAPAGAAPSSPDPTTAAPTPPGTSAAPPNDRKPPAPPTDTPATGAPVTGAPTTPRAPATTAPQPPAPPTTTRPTTTAPGTTPPPAKPTTAPPSSAVAPPRPAAAVDDRVTVTAGGQVSFNLLANDTGSGLYVVGSPLALGLYGNIWCDKSSGACTYRTWTPWGTGTDTFSYTVRDRDGRYSTATIRVTVRN